MGTILVLISWCCGMNWRDNRCYGFKNTPIMSWVFGMLTIINIMVYPFKVCFLCRCPNYKPDIKIWWGYMMNNCWSCSASVFHNILVISQNISSSVWGNRCINRRYSLKVNSLQKEGNKNWIDSSLPLRAWKPQEMLDSTDIELLSFIGLFIKLSPSSLNH